MMCRSSIVDAVSTFKIVTLINSLKILTLLLRNIGLMMVVMAETSSH